MSGGTPHWTAGLGETENECAKGVQPVAELLRQTRVPTALQEAVRTMHRFFKNGELEGWVDVANDHYKMPPGGRLTAEQSKAVFLYTLNCGFYVEVNTVLRESYKSRSDLLLTLPYLRLLGSALKAAPRFEGSVYRGIKDEGGTVFDYYTSKVGGTAVWYQVNSCTQRVGSLDNFLGGEYMMFTIEGAVGAEVAAYSAVPTEAEVVLFSCSRYKVLSCGAIPRLVQLGAVHEAHDEFYDLHEVVKAAGAPEEELRAEVAELRKQLEEKDKGVTDLAKQKEENEAALMRQLEEKDKRVADLVREQEEKVAALMKQLEEKDKVSAIVRKPEEEAPLIAELESATKDLLAGGRRTEVELDGSALDIRVGLVKEVRMHPDADSLLYVAKIDVGEAGPRKICLGLVAHMPASDIEGEAVVVMCNLKPTRMRGIVSSGMVMCSTSSDGHVALTIPPAGAATGDKIILESLDKGGGKARMPLKKLGGLLAGLQADDKGDVHWRDAAFTVKGKGAWKSLHNGAKVN